MSREVEIAPYVYVGGSLDGRTLTLPVTIESLNVPIPPRSERPNSGQGVYRVDRLPEPQMGVHGRLVWHGQTIA